MRIRKLALTLLAALSCGFIASQPAAATDIHHAKPPAGWGHQRVINHYVYYPRYHHVYHVHGATDPYAYRPATRGYYPYYNSGYWRPATYRHRPHYQLPAYYPAWGYTKRWQHKKWHAVHHGRHKPWHW